MIFDFEEKIRRRRTHLKDIMLNINLSVNHLLSSNMALASSSNALQRIS
uniref:N-alpha-acetyltransferase 40 isoform X2 n=1 Tax=Rhizophora mucronata TaxID=61149 RepID=A0A2P2LKU7_RHIMU